MRSIAAGLGLLSLALAAQAPPDRIGPDTVDRLAVAWTYDTRESTEPLRPGTDRPAFEATPVYEDGRLYLSTPGGLVIALDADTGTEAWRIDLRIRRDANYSDFASRGVAVIDGRIYAATVDGRLVCIAARDGRFCDGFGSGGKVDLTKGLRRRPEWSGEYGVTSPPAIYRDLVIVGSSVADNSRARMASGEVRAFDRRSGALRWTFHPLPENATAGGANTWSRIIVDDANGLVFLPTSSPSPDYFGGLRPGDNRLANAIVVLRAATGDVVWSFQTVHHDLWDYDVASPPLLFPGKDGAAVAVGSKTGHLFLFERLSGRPIFPIRERPVPASDVAGETAASTQPFPDQPASLAATADQRGRYLGLDATRSRRVSCHVPLVAPRGRIHSAQHPWKPSRSRQYRRASLGRDGVGSDHTHDRRAREPRAGDRSPGAARRLRTHPSKQPKPGDHRTAWHTVRDVTTILSRTVRHSVRRAAVGRVGRNSRGHRRDGVANHVRRLEHRVQALVDSANWSAQSRRPGHDDERARLHRCDARPVSPGLRYNEWTSGVGGAAADERPRDSASLHHTERSRDGRDRGRWSRHATIHARLDPCRLWPAKSLT